MLIRYGDTNRVVNSENCIAHVYPFGSENTSLAVVEINGRYPLGII